MRKRLSLFTLFITSAFSLFAMPPCAIAPLSRFEVRHLEPQGVGFNQGYTSLALFFTPSWDKMTYPFLDLRAHVFNDGMFASNVGAGVRMASQRWDLSWGVNAYYDYRGFDELHINQGAIGLEWLSPCYDVRINGFYPFSGKSNVSNPKFSHFCGYDAFASQRVKGALPMIEAEVRVPLYKRIDFSGGLGIYYLFKRNVCDVILGDALGGRVRLVMRPTDGLLLEGEVTFDEIFRTRGNGAIRLSFPLGPGNMRTRGRRFREKFSSGCLSRAREIARLTQPIWRSEIIPIESGQRCFPILCRRTKQEKKILFVRGNKRGEQGEGSFEKPYASLNKAAERASASDVIYLLCGDEASLSQSITLAPQQCLIGSCENMILEQIDIPALTPQILPKVRGKTNTPVVHIGEQSIVRGIAFDGAGLNTENAGTFVVRNCSFTNDQPALLINGGKKGRKEISDTLFYGDQTALQIAISDGSELVIRNNRFVDFTRCPIEFTDREIKNCKIAILENEFYEIGARAIDLPMTMDKCSISIASNVFKNISNDTIALRGEMRESDLQIVGNEFSKLLASALYVNSLSGSHILFSANEIEDARRGMKFGSSPSCFARGSTVITDNNRFIDLGDSSVDISLSMERSTLTVEKNSFLRGGDALFAQEGSSFNRSSLQLIDNRFEQLERDALFFLSPLKNCQVLVKGNTLVDLGGGLHFSEKIFSSNFAITQNSWERVKESSFGFQHLNESDLQFEHNTFSSLEQGIALRHFARGKIELIDNTFTQLAGQDVEIIADHGDVFLERNLFSREFSMQAFGSSSLYLSNNSSPLYRLINEKGEDFFLQPPNPTEFTQHNTGMVQAIGENFLFTAPQKKTK